MSIARRLIASMSFLPCPNAFFERCRSHNICQVKSLGSLQRFKLSSTFCIEAHQTYTHLNSNRLVDQSGYSSGEVRVFSYQLARKTSASYGRSPSAVPDCGSREYTIMRIDCARRRHTRARFHFPVHLRNHSSGFVGRGGNVQHSRADDRMRIPDRSFRRGNRASAAAISSRRVDMQHRSEGRTGPWLAAGYAMCFRCERNGTTIRLHRHDQAPWRRYWCDKRGNAILGCFCAKQPDRPRHAKRKLRRCQRQRCLRPGSRRQGADRRIPPHDNVAAVVGRRSDRT